MTISVASPQMTGGWRWKQEQGCRDVQASDQGHREESETGVACVDMKWEVTTGIVEEDALALLDSVSP